MPDWRRASQARTWAGTSSWAQAKSGGSPGVPLLPPRRRRACCSCGCLLPVLALLALLAVYFLAPGRTKLLIIGLDAREPGSNLGRSDTLILTTVVPSEPYVGMLSIPRDLWVAVPGHGENRINSAHFFAEGEQPGTGPQATMETVASNFGVPVRYYLRLRFDSLENLVEAMDGVTVELPQAMSGYQAGSHHLDGEAALAFVRDRQGSDDFFRMQRGQIFLRGALETLRQPANWRRLPAILRALPRFADTNLPLWLWPRLGLALLRVGPQGVDARALDRQMARPTTTAVGAAVLDPDWGSINTMTREMFGAP